MLKPNNYILGTTKNTVTENNLNDFFDVRTKIIVGKEDNKSYSGFIVLGTKE